MRNPVAMPPNGAVLVVCAAVLVLLVLAEGWTWPLKLAAVMIPLTYLIG
jgi:hypothetical protein